MEIKVPKEVRQYHESIFFGLSLRQFGCSLAAVGAAVGLYFGCMDMLGTEATGWVCILGAAPLALAGFFTYNLSLIHISRKPLARWLESWLCTARPICTMP